MNAVKIPEPKLPERLAADKAYSSSAIRVWLRDRAIEDVIPTKSNENPNPDFDKASYRRRNIVERCVSWMKEARRVATRYEKLARNYLSMVKLSMIDRLFRGLQKTKP
jgi:transposase